MHILLIRGMVEVGSVGRGAVSRQSFRHATIFRTGTAHLTMAVQNLPLYARNRSWPTPFRTGLNRVLWLEVGTNRKIKPLSQGSSVNGTNSTKGEFQNRDNLFPIEEEIASSARNRAEVRQIDVDTSNKRACPLGRPFRHFPN